MQILDEPFVFMQGVSETELADTFRVYFGGADTVVGTAVIQVKFVTTA